MLLAGVGYLVGYDGKFLFDHIGDDYAKNNVPYVVYRLWCALCGAGVVPLAYLTLREMSVSIAGATLCALLLVFDNALITQSRLILLDSMLMLFCVLCTFFWVKFYKQRHDIKMVGLFTMGVVGIATLVDLWELLDIRRGLTLRVFTKHFAARALCLIFLPFFLYLVPFYIHFNILINSGPGDAFMSMRFQETLVGNAATAGAVSIMYGANVTIKHGETSVFLHSHSHRYPLKYDDGRISSQGQQIVGYAHSDRNSVWQMVPLDPEYHPSADDYEETEEETKRGVRYVRSGDIVQLYHVMTESYLLTHDVASPLTTTHMEMTTIKEEDFEQRYNETLWRVQVVDADDGDKLKSKKQLFRLVSHQHRVAVSSEKLVLPEWGFKMQQINGNKNTNEKTSLWRIASVEHERIVDGVEIGEERSDSGKPPLNFMSKFVELQKAMIHHNAALTKPHPYSSSPGIWPFVIRGISFWEKKEGLRQIYLLGNPLVWWFSILSVAFYGALWLVDRLCLRRGLDDFGANARRWWDRAIGYLVVAWALHWLPFFLMGRMLFLHHYLPAFIYSTMVAAALFDFLGRAVFAHVPRRGGAAGQAVPVGVWFSAGPSIAYYAVLAGVLAACMWSFWYFSPYSYGSGFATVEQLRAHKWLSTWDLQYA
nr:hypothetical protein HK105_003295 [Polyrhizophydium stewartii]